MLKKLAERVRSIDINQILDEVLEGEKTYILDLIRLQLIKGEGGDGKLDKYAWYKRGSILSKEWIDYKHKIGLFIGGSDPNYDLYGDTKTFYNSLDFTVNQSSIETLSTDPKLESIEQSTEMDIANGHALELNENSLELLRVRIQPLIQQKINAKLGI